MPHVHINPCKHIPVIPHYRRKTAADVGDDSAAAESGAEGQEPVPAVEDGQVPEGGTMLQVPLKLRSVNGPLYC